VVVDLKVDHCHAVEVGVEGFRPGGWVFLGGLFRFFLFLLLGAVLFFFFDAGAVVVVEVRRVG